MQDIVKIEQSYEKNYTKLRDTHNYYYKVIRAICKSCRLFAPKSLIAERVRDPLIRALLPTAWLCDIKAACTKARSTER